MRLGSDPIPTTSRNRNCPDAGGIVTTFKCRTCGITWQMGPTRDMDHNEQCHYCAREGNGILNARVAELEAILWGHVIVAGETKAITASLEKCMEMECALPSATVKMAKEALSLRKKALKELSLA